MSSINIFSIRPTLTKSGKRRFPEGPKFEDIPDGSVIRNRHFISGTTQVLRVSKTRNFKNNT